MKTTTLRALALAAGALPAAAQGTINVEIDYMVAAGHSHAPTQAQLDPVIQMFACQGWTLNILIDDAIPEIPVMQCDDLSDWFMTCSGASSFKSIKDTWFDNAGGPWHYCVFGHQYTTDGVTFGSSGIADGADDFVVTLWGFSGLPNGSDFDIAATFAHELGHNLGLGHAAPFSVGAGNYSPNYASVMSYQYQLNGVRTRLSCLGLIDDTAVFKELDYSHGRLPILQETDLDETVGVGILRTDFDCDGTFSLSVAQDISNGGDWCTNTGTLGNLQDYDDWANIVDVPSTPMPAPPHQEYTCITREEAEAVRSLLGGQEGFNCPDPVHAVEPCVSTEMYWVDPANVLPGTGAGGNPFQNLSGALGAVPSGSVLYLQPGSHLVSGGSLLLTTPVLLAGPGGAVVDP